MGGKPSKPKRKSKGGEPTLIHAVKNDIIMDVIEGRPEKMIYVNGLFKSSPEKFKSLLEAEDDEGRTALDFAKLHDRQDIVEFLEEKRNDVEETKKPEGGARGGSRRRRKGKKSA
jgi:ankyrin repeat protein